MFINITREGHESLYECDRYHTHALNEHEFMIDLEKDHGLPVSIQIDKRERIGVYCMNNEGKTINRLFSNL